MYRFQIVAPTQPGETIGLVGSISEMGLWDVVRCVRLRTSRDRYPLWWADLAIDIEPLLLTDGSLEPKIEYKYVRLQVDGSVQWELSQVNRWVPVESGGLDGTLIVDDGSFGKAQFYPYGYFADREKDASVTGEVVTDEVVTDNGVTGEGLKIVVIGSSVALGCSAWLLKGWAWQLAQALKPNGHQLVNVSQLGANVSTTIARFAQVVAPYRPHIVIIALSLGNEGLAHCPANQRRMVQRRFESGLQQLINMTREMGAYPILGGVYPNGDYTSEHYELLLDTHHRMQTWNLPILNWLSALDDGQGRWKPGIFLDVAHPNSLGHRVMFEAIALQWFQLTPDELSALDHSIQSPSEIPIYADKWGFRLSTHPDGRISLVNDSPYSYTMSFDWQAFQIAVRKAHLARGVYVTQNFSDTALVGFPSFLAVHPDGAIATPHDIPPGTDLEYYPAFPLFALHYPILFDDGQLRIFKSGDRDVYILNESDHDYNLHPMWKEVRRALQALPSGVYADLTNPDAPFRTLIIAEEGLESRVKAPPHSALWLQYRSPLSEISRVAIISLGDRCAVRMLLYKLEYDGPAFPFDLTRTTNLADVVDIIQRGFHEMWNPALLHYNHEARRIYHTLWTGLSFAHEVDESDDPVHDLSPVHERMRVRYSARAARFWYTLQHCDKALFVRTGVCDRNAVTDLMQKLEAKCQGKPLRLLLISPQASDEFADIPNVLHYNLELNPDRMYEDLGHWLYCTEIMRGILDSLGVSSQNLFWCPPHPMA